MKQPHQKHKSINYLFELAKNFGSVSNLVSNGERKKNKLKKNMPYVAKVSQVSQRNREDFSKHNIPEQFKPNNTFKWKLLHPKDKTHKQHKFLPSVSATNTPPVHLQ